MNDGILAVVGAMMSLIIGAVIGATLAYSSMYGQCEKLGRVIIRDGAYSCERLP